MGPANQQPENTGAQRVCWSGLGEGQGGQTGSSSSHLLWGGCSNCNGQSANWEGGLHWLAVVAGREWHRARGASGWHLSGGSVWRSTQGWGSRLPAPEARGHNRGREERMACWAAATGC